MRPAGKQRMGTYVAAILAWGFDIPRQSFSSQNEVLGNIESESHPKAIGEVETCRCGAIQELRRFCAP